MEEGPLLTRENWKEAVLKAITELPRDLQASTGHSTQSDNVMIITVAGEHLPSNEDDIVESSISRIRVSYWNSLRERGWPSEFHNLYGPGGIQEEHVNGLSFRSRAMR